MPQPRRSLADSVGLFVATCGYVGFVPVAPGTAGSIVGVALFYLTRSLGPWPELGVIALVAVVGTWAATATERALQRTDPGPVVIDEVLGTLLTLCWLPVTATGALVGFLVFRVLDVIKPWPARRFEQLHGGAGIMADDAMAGVYGHLVMRALIALAPEGWLV